MLMSSACLQMVFVGLKDRDLWVINKSRLSLNVKEQNDDFLYGD